MVIGKSDRFFDAFIYLVLIAVGLISLFPILYVISMSLTPYSEVIKHGGFLIFPRSITFEAYDRLLTGGNLPKAFGISVFLATVGTGLNMLLTVLAAYPLSRRKLPGRSAILLFIIITMLFNGGLIPTYILVKSLGLLNSVWALIIPSALATFNMLIMKSFFESLPEELYESARMDGAGEFRMLFSIAIPLSIPSLMTVGLFYMVSNWNSFFSAILYVTDPAKQPLQVVVRNLLLMSQDTELQAEVTLPTETLQMAAVILASVPILAVYPFIQKYFMKGMVLGAIKG